MLGKIGGKYYRERLIRKSSPKGDHKKTERDYLRRIFVIPHQEFLTIFRCSPPAKTGCTSLECQTKMLFLFGIPLDIHYLCTHII